jgi:hypothetical protein
VAVGSSGSSSSRPCLLLQLQILEKCLQHACSFRHQTLDGLLLLVLLLVLLLFLLIMLLLLRGREDGHR